ncbi:13793_t:CDS:2 [Entrophospora sp. SA101]|nr:13793_t:CDS:2 [Entrophospora sp. SA101]
MNLFELKEATLIKYHSVGFSLSDHIIGGGNSNSNKLIPIFSNWIKLKELNLELFKNFIDLYRFEYFPTMVVTLVQLLIPLRAVNDLNKGLEPLTVHALRLVKLTQCISAVMKFNESGETILHNPIMNVCPEMVIISWNDAGAIIEDTSISSTDQIF